MEIKISTAILSIVGGLSGIISLITNDSTGMLFAILLILYAILWK